jgi:hypothetical protein
MSNATDMSIPVTRGEFQEELRKLATKADLERFATKADLERFATKADLEICVGALAERIAETYRTLSAELAGHAKAYLESTSRNISVMDDKYKSLPARMERLEAKVFPTSDAGRPENA